MALSPIATFYTGSGPTTIGASVYPDGTYIISGTNATRCCYRGIVEYWVASPACVGRTIVGQGAQNALALPNPSAATALEALILASSSTITTLQTLNPLSAYLEAFVTQ